MEQHFIGALLTNPKLITSYISTPEEFFQDEVARQVFIGIKKLFSEHGVFDIALATDYFSDNEEAQMFMAESLVNTPGTHAIRAYYDKMLDIAAQKELRIATLQMQDSLHGGDTHHAEMCFQNAMKKIRSWRKEDDNKNPQINTWYETMCSNIDNRGNIGVKTGYVTLDSVLGDLLPGQMHVLGARPKVGKSMVAANIALNVAKKNKHVVYYSFEMSLEQMMNRLVSMYTKIPHVKFQRNNITLNDLSLVSPHVDAFLKLPLTFVCKAGMTVDEIDGDLTDRADERPVDLVVVDYLQLVGHKSLNRYERITDISNRLKGIAMKRQVPILSLSQMSRESADGEPQVHHLRESGSIEQDAESIMLLWKEEVDTVDPRELKLLLRGNRNGPGYLNLILDVDYSTYTVLEKAPFPTR